MRSLVYGPEPAIHTLHLSAPIVRGTTSATVFVIDHDAAVRDALSVTLRGSGFDVAAYDSAGDFLGALPVRKRGCLLVEFDLLDMTGAELVDRLHGRRIDLPAIIMSARLRPPVFQPRRPLAVSAILQKPFGQDELLRCVHRRARPAALPYGNNT